MLPTETAWLKTWLCIVATYVSFYVLFYDATVGGVPPPATHNRGEEWVRRLLLCALLFTSVSVAIVIAANVTVAVLYAEGSRQKIVAALQHEYVMYRLIREKLRADDEQDVSHHRGGLTAFARRQRLRKRHTAIRNNDGGGGGGGCAGGGGPRDAVSPSQVNLHLGGADANGPPPAAQNGSGKVHWYSGLFNSVSHHHHHPSQPQLAGSQYPQEPTPQAAPVAMPGGKGLRHGRHAASAPDLQAVAAMEAAEAEADALAGTVGVAMDSGGKGLGPCGSSEEGPGAGGAGEAQQPRPVVRVEAYVAQSPRVLADPSGGACAAKQGSAPGSGAATAPLPLLPRGPSGNETPPGPGQSGSPSSAVANQRRAGGANASRFYPPGGPAQGGGAAGQLTPPSATTGAHVPPTVASNATETYDGPYPDEPRFEEGGSSGSDRGTDRAGTDRDHDSEVADNIRSSAVSMSSSVGPTSLRSAMRRIGGTDMVHLRRTLLAALEMYAWLRERQQNPSGVLLVDKSRRGGVSTSLSGRALLSSASKADNATGGLAGCFRRSATADSADGAKGPRRSGASKSAGSLGDAGALRRELHAMRVSRARLVISPRVLLDELLTMYSGLSDHDIPDLARLYADAVWECAAPDEENLRETDFLHIFPKESDRRIAWDALDGNHDGLLTKEEVTAAATAFLQQERAMALTVRAVRRLTRSLQMSFIGIVNGIFLMAVYLAILDVTRFFTGGSSSKTSLDIFTAYVVVVTLVFSEQIKNVLAACMLLLVQQAFDIGEEIIFEEAPGWRAMGVVQDFNLFFLRLKKSTDGELVTLPLNKLSTARFTNLTRSDWKIEQNYFAVDISAPPSLLSAMTEAALEAIRAAPGEYDVNYGFMAFFHAIDKPNKVIIRTFHRYRFNLAAPHKRIAKARHGVTNAVRATLDRMGIQFTELRMHAPLPALPHLPGSVAAAEAAAASVAASTAAVGPPLAGWGVTGVAATVAAAAPGVGMPAALESSWAQRPK
ncbi:hypothetical protein HYH03_011832 [Edaphochlamys debaryana]|uniref:EF-hand domain-containing protein n=1 Tax=Edaphochlamys debaryana TaxID=47281 RepID=A0A835XZG1_9CHLO|nr:hypothetical protein HYH03_011832 [Edaphochlamys debaryana]|eukprot:KAG2489725.1 hypothetical protein HYH03_011832 [Edaphochlamys debaryana]